MICFCSWRDSIKQIVIGYLFVTNESFPHPSYKYNEMIKTRIYRCVRKYQTAIKDAFGSIFKAASFSHMHVLDSKLLHEDTWWYTVTNTHRSYTFRQTYLVRTRVVGISKAIFRIEAGEKISIFSYFHMIAQKEHKTTTNNTQMP